MWEFFLGNCNSIITSVQLKDLTHMFYLEDLNSQTIYKGDIFSCILTLKYMCHVEMSS
jgi:hypothetical protein